MRRLTDWIPAFAGKTVRPDSGVFCDAVELDELVLGRRGVIPDLGSWRRYAGHWIVVRGGFSSGVQTVPRHAGLDPESSPGPVMPDSIRHPERLMSLKALDPGLRRDDGTPLDPGVRREDDKCA